MNGSQHPRRSLGRRNGSGPPPRAAPDVHRGEPLDGPMMALPEGAHLTYRELLDAADQPKPAVQEDYRSMARIARAFRYDDASIAAAAGEGASPQIYMHREEKPFQAYALTGRSINLNHHHPDWGHVHFGFVMPRRGEHFVVPSNRNEVKHVAIKQLRKSVFHQAIALGGPNNPYKEVAFLQELGDDIHVLRPIEALEDDEFLYIVTPRGLATLVEAIPWNSPQTLEPNRIRSIFRQLLEIQAYLLRHKVCHRDLSPDNFLFLTEDNLVVFDFGYSLRIPVDDQTGRRYLMQEQGVFGTPPYMSPEVFRNHPYDGVNSDFWALAVILFNLLTNQPLYHFPHIHDACFGYFILAEGLSSTRRNDRLEQVFSMVAERARATGIERPLNDLKARVQATLRLDTSSVELLEHLLAIDPRDRWSLAQAFEYLLRMG